MPDALSSFDARSFPTLKPGELDAVRRLVGALERDFPGEAILGAPLGRITALIHDPGQRKLVDRILRLRPKDVGVVAEACTGTGWSPEPILNNIVAIDSAAMLAGQRIPTSERLIRVTGQQYYSVRQEKLATMRPVLAVTATIPVLVEMQREVKADLGEELRIASQYRSRGHQLALILRELVETGGDTAQVFRSIALPGYSQHQDMHCPAFDFATREGRVGEEFADTPEYAWLASNGPEFGFFLSYPEGNTTGIKSEPWHWQYRPRQAGG